MKKQRIAVITLGLFLIFSGCRSIPYDRGSLLEDKQLLALLIAKGKKLYPQSFQAIHRVILRVGEKEFVFEGYVLLKKPDKIRLLAKGFMGTTVFDVVQNGNGHITILQNSAFIQPSWIKAGALRDVRALYLTSWWDKGILIRHRFGAVGIAYDRADGMREEFVFDSTYHLMHYFRYQGNDCLYEIEFLTNASKASKTLEISDYKLGYHLTIQVIELEECSLDDELFASKK